MDKQEPRIISPGYSDNELADWLEGKVRAARQLHALLSEKAIHEERLGMLETEISALSQKAAIEVFREEELTHGEFRTPAEEMITIDKALFKQLLQLVLNLPDLGNHLATVDVDAGSAAAGEMLIRLEPSDLLLRLNAALGACR